MFCFCQSHRPRFQFSVLSSLPEFRFGLETLGTAKFLWRKKKDELLFSPSTQEVCEGSHQTRGNARALHAQTAQWAGPSRRRTPLRAISPTTCTSDRAQNARLVDSDRTKTVQLLKPMFHSSPVGFKGNRFHCLVMLLF